ncbi:MAG: PilX N-terminal domain-containing pilus assembly protein [Desulfobacterium sp.]|jgi:hypothetical protein|nr:PilX N-terminal domain-containing pilus assembly protein [Desulfobacterium sp.]
MAKERMVIKCMNNENGYALLGTLLILVLLIVIGMAASTNTSLELQIANNDRIHKETFYQADGGTQLAIRLVEESLGISGPFTALDVNGILIDPVSPNNTIQIVDDTLWDNADNDRDETDVFDDNAVGGGRDVAYFPNGYDPTNVSPHTNIIVDGVTSTAAGAGLQMLAGYEGIGKGTAGGGGQILYTIYSQHMGKTQSESVVKVKWRHVIRLELEGRY